MGGGHIPPVELNQSVCVCVCWSVCVCGVCVLINDKWHGITQKLVSYKYKICIIYSDEYPSVLVVSAVQILYSICFFKSKLETAQEEF